MHYRSAHFQLVVVVLVVVREVENFPEGEKREMTEIYEDKYGFTPEDARSLVDMAFKYKVHIERYSDYYIVNIDPF